VLLNRGKDNTGAKMMTDTVKLLTAAASRRRVRRFGAALGRVATANRVSKGRLMRDSLGRAQKKRTQGFESGGDGAQLAQRDQYLLETVRAICRSPAVREFVVGITASPRPTISPRLCRRPTATGWPDAHRPPTQSPAATAACVL
jgi:hypothetical protein